VRPEVASVPGVRAASGRFIARREAGARSGGEPLAGLVSTAEPDEVAAGASATDVPPTFTSTGSSVATFPESRIVKTPQNATTRIPKNTKPSFFSLLMSVTLP